MAGYYVRRIILGDEIGGEDHIGEKVDRLVGVCYGKRDGDHRG